MESSTLRKPGPEGRGHHGALRIPVRPEAVVRARSSVRQAAADAELSTDRIDDLVVAVSEACTNAMEAQLAAGVTDPIEISCRVDERCFEVQIRDRGAGFAPDAVVPRPPLTDPGHLAIERGWGIQLMRQLVDELVFDLAGPGTCVLLRVLR